MQIGRLSSRFFRRSLLALQKHFFFVDFRSITFIFVRNRSCVVCVCVRICSKFVLAPLNPFATTTATTRIAKHQSWTSSRRWDATHRGTTRKVGSNLIHCNSSPSNLSICLAFHHRTPVIRSSSRTVYSTPLLRPEGHAAW